MNGKEIALAWERICIKIKSYSGVSASQIDAIFSRLELQAIGSDCAFITADTDFIRNWVERYYFDYLKQAFKDIYGTDFTIFLELNNMRPSAEITQSIPDIPASALLEESRKETITSKRIEQENKKQTTTKDIETKILEEYENKELNEPYTFDHFVIGNSNQTAYKMAVSVAENPGKKQALNPLFIYGKSGLGKTHLLRAIQNYIQKSRPKLRVVYVDSAEFLNDYTDSVAAHETEKTSYKKFRNKYEQADVLLIDDVQFFQFKTQTLDILFQFFNSFIDKGKQIVLSADRSPKNIDVDERYRSRFASGGTFDIQPPEIETKLGIIKNYIDEYNENEDGTKISISPEIQNYIAEHSSSNIRELKGAVTIIICKLLDKQTMSLSDAAEILREHFQGSGAKKLSIQDIQNRVESFYKVKHTDLIGKGRSKNIVYPRQIAMYLSRELIPDISFDQIGDAFNQHHTTAIYSHEKVGKGIAQNRETREEIEALRRIILEE